MRLLTKSEVIYQKLKRVSDTVHSIDSIDRDSESTCWTILHNNPSLLLNSVFPNSDDYDPSYDE